MSLTLTPVTGSLSVIAKMAKTDPSAARSLLQFALYDSLVDQANALAPMIERSALQHMAAVNKVARTRMLRTHVGKAIDGQPEPDDLEYAKALGQLDTWVEKGLLGSMLAAFNQRVHRDEDGKFTRGGGNRTYGSGSDRSQHGGPHGSAQRGAFNTMQFGTGATDQQAQGMTQRMFDDRGHLKPGDRAGAQWNGPTEGVDRQAYNRLRLTGEALTNVSRPGSKVHTAGTVAQLAGQLGPEAEKVLGPSVRRTAYRYRGTERRPEKALVQDVAAISNIAEFEADTQDRKGSPANGAAATARLKGTALVQRRPGAPVPKQPDAVKATVDHYRKFPGLSGDERKLRMRGDVAVASLLGVGKPPGSSRVPNMKLAELSIASGELPPSEGVLINAKGKVSTQSIGYNGDHYLPFDLSNLEDMAGGQYVRTRATGGLTGEDIYTGLVAGARQAQVVSNSGVFTLEFDPDFRGSRRYGDKAHRMIERYTSILGAIDDKGSELFLQDVDNGTKQRIRQEVGEIATGEDDFAGLYTARLNEARLKGMASPASIDEITEMAENKARHALASRLSSGASMSSQQQAQYVDDIKNEKIDEAFSEGEGTPAVQRMKLDGEGYSRALQALKQEFPYYIRSVDYQTVPEWLDSRNLDAGDNRPRGVNRQADRGYTAAGQTNAKSTLGTAARPATGFRSARRVPTRALSRSSTTEEGSEPGAQSAPGAASTPTAGRPAAAPVTQAALIRPGAPFVRQMGAKLGDLMNELTQVTPTNVFAPTDATLENESGYSWGDVFARKMRDESQPGQVANETARWLANPETPAEDRKKFIQAVREGAESSWNKLVGEGRAEVKSIMVEGLKTLEEFDSMIDPFDPRPQDQMMTEGFGSKPPKLAKVPELGSPPSDFTSVIAREDSKIREKIEEWDAGGETDIPGVVESARQALASNELNGAVSPTELQQDQREFKVMLAAWSLRTARDASAKLRAAAGVVDAPKAPAPVKAPAPAAPEVPAHRQHALSLKDWNPLEKALYPPLPPISDRHADQIRKALGL